MGTFTRDWDEATPSNLTEAHQIDDYLKYRVIDVAERLKAMFYGFTAGENTLEASLKFLNLKDQDSVAVPSTGYSRLYSATVENADEDDVSELIHQNDEGVEVQITNDGALNWDAITIPADDIDETHIELTNDAYLVAANEADDGDVSLIKAGRNEADDDDVAILPDAARLASDAAPTEDTQVVNKKYVDDHDAERVQADGTTVFNTTLTAANTWQDLDLSEYVGESVAFVFLEAQASGGCYFVAKPKGYGSVTTTYHGTDGNTNGVGCCYLDANKVRYLMCMTDATGIIQIAANIDSATVTVKLVGFSK